MINNFSFFSHLVLTFTVKLTVRDFSLTFVFWNTKKSVEVWLG